MIQVIQSALIWLVLLGLGHLPLAKWIGTAQSHDEDSTCFFRGLLCGSKQCQSKYGGEILSSQVFETDLSALANA